MTCTFGDKFIEMEHVLKVLIRITNLSFKNHLFLQSTKTRKLLVLLFFDPIWAQKLVQNTQTGIFSLQFLNYIGHKDKFAYTPIM